MNDKNLIVFFSWNRGDLVERSFNSLLESIRKQDRLMVIDQEMRNFDFYAKHKDKIDFLYFTHLNYDIGPIWMFIRNFLMWKKSLIKVYEDARRPNKGWYPDFVNIVESDTIGKKGWIDRVIRIFDSEKYQIGIASGYDGIEHSTIKWDGRIKIKNTVCGVQAMFRTEYFLKLFKVLHLRSQDDHVSKINTNIGKVVGVLPGEIEHIGIGRKSFGNIEEINT